MSGSWPSTRRSWRVLVLRSTGPTLPRSRGSLRPTGSGLLRASVVQLPDADDLPFIDVALSGKADALVTGNARHFPKGLGVVVLSPRDLLQRLEAEQ